MRKIILLIALSLCLVCVFTACNNSHTHIWGKYVDYNQEYHYKVCSSNNTHIEKDSHHYDKGKVVTEATEASVGFLEYKCVECGRKKIEKIPMKGNSNYKNKIVDPKYLKIKISDATSIYYMSSDMGTYGDDNYVFEYTTIPEEYTEVEYLESLGTSYIDTGIEASSGIESEIKFSSNTNRGLQCYLGAKVDDIRCTSLFISSGKHEICYYNKYIQSEQTIKIGEIEIAQSHLYKNNQYLKINGKQIISDTISQDINLGVSMYLFKANCSIDYYANGKIYYCKIWKEGTLVRNYIPVVRNSDGIAGMYDLVSEVFFEGIDDAKKGFKAGKDVVEDLVLPEGYTQLQHIQTSGAQFIDTGVLQKSTLTYDCKFYVMDATNLYLFSSTTDSYFYSYNALFSNNVLCGNYYDYYYPTNNTIEMTQRIVDDKIVSNVNGNEFSSSIANAPNDPVCLFACNNGKNLYNGRVKCFYFKIYDNNVLIRDFIPCRRFSDGSIGMYDLVNGEFYDSEIKHSGNSNFDAGNPVGHTYDEGVVIKEATYGEEGVREYTCINCGNKYYKKINPLAYSVKFDIDEGVDSIRVYKSNEPNDYVNTLSTYTINQNTYNYSYNNAIVKFEVILKEGYEIEKINNFPCLVNNGIYTTAIIKENKTILIKTKKST